MDQPLHIQSLADLKKEFESVSVTRTIHKRNLSSVDKLALVITQRIGTMGFFFTILTWTVLWLGWNTLAPTQLRFDPYPAFVLWLIISNLIQIHLMPLIMIGQNIQGKHAQLQGDYDYETDRKSEKEIETVLMHLERQHTLMVEILKRVESFENKHQA